MQRHTQTRWSEGKSQPAGVSSPPPSPSPWPTLAADLVGTPAPITAGELIQSVWPFKALHVGDTFALGSISSLKSSLTTSYSLSSGLRGGGRTLDAVHTASFLAKPGRAGSPRPWSPPRMCAPSCGVD